MKKPRVSIVVAMGAGRLHNRVIGNKNQLLWHIPEDLKRFKQLTFGHPVIMGRKTFDSIVAVLGKPLPGRTNIVVTRDSSWKYDGLDKSAEGGPIAVGSIEEGLEKARETDQEEIFLGGGAQIYAQGLKYVDKLYLTLIEDEKEGDCFFPEYEKDFTKKTFEEAREHNGLKYRWVNLERTIA